MNNGACDIENSIITKVCVIAFSNFSLSVDGSKYRIAKSLVDAGYDVTVLAIKDAKTKSREIIDGIKVSRIDGRNRPIKFLKFLFSALKQKPDIYHSFDLKTLPLAYFVSRINRSKLIYDSRELYVESMRDKELPKVYKRIMTSVERFLIKRVDGIIVVSDARADILVQRYGIKRPTVIFNCAPYKEYRKTTIIRDLLNIKDDKRIVLYQGIISRGRGLENLVSAARYLDDAVVVLIGDGNLKGELIRKVKEEDLEEKVKFIDAVPYEELLDYTMSADLGVHPIQNTCLNHYYCAPNKLFEYLMAGLPVAVSNFPDMRRIVENEGVGETFDPEDPKDIARVINNILNDEEKYNIMSGNALKIAKERYNWEMESRKMLEVYERARTAKT